MARSKDISITYPPKWRVLVVDNDNEYRQDHKINLEHWGFEPTLAEGRGRGLIKDAKAKVRTARCHIALVDMRLRDDDDLSDWSGLELVQELQPAYCIVVTGFGNMEVARESMKQYGAYDIVGKEEGPDKLRTVIKNAVAEIWDRQIEVVWPSHFAPEMIVQKLSLNPAELIADQLQSALPKVYAANKSDEQIVRLVLHPLGRGHLTPRSIPTDMRSMVFISQPYSQNGDRMREDVLKIASLPQIKKEVAAYHTYVSPYLIPSHTARIEDQSHWITLWDIGVIRYTNIGDEDRRSLEEWYQDTAIDSAWLERSLEYLFTRTFAPWYEREMQKSMRNLFDYYMAVFRKQDALAAHPCQEKWFNFPSLNKQLPNVVAWVQIHREKSNFESYWEAYTHGDLHMNNVFANGNARTIIIDFERSGPGHILRDFVELETDILLNQLCFDDAQLPYAWQFASLLLGQDVPAKPPQWQLIMPDKIGPGKIGPDRSESSAKLKPALEEKLEKAFKSVVKIRQLAFETTAYGDMGEYFWALLMDALLFALRVDSMWGGETVGKPPVNQWVFLWAGMLCERIMALDAIREEPSQVLEKSPSL